MSKLSTILSASASIALPEIVSVFINKYETELYTSKDQLNEKINGLQSELNLLKETVASKADFSKYEKLGIPTFNLTAKVRKSLSIDWESRVVEAMVDFRTPRKANANDLTTRFTETVTAPIIKRDLATFEKISNDLSEARSQLSQILTSLSDMSRKERQVKARISELRLEEQGLTDFLKDEQILALISPK